MQVKIDAISKIDNENSYTYYFYQREFKIVLPIEYWSSKNDEDTYIRTLNALKVTIEKISIYLYFNNQFYSYIKIKTEDGRFYDINSSISNALNIKEILPEIPMYIEFDILNSQGIKVTKELLERSLLD